MKSLELDLKELNHYMFVDPASKPKPGQSLKKSRSRQAIIVLAADWIPRYFVRLAWAGKLPTSRFTDKIISTHRDYRPRLCGIEANAMQELYADMVIEKARTLERQVAMYPYYQPTKVEKNWRIRTILEPVINDGRLFIMEGMQDLEAEIQGFPTLDRKDLVDALASCISLVPRTARRRREKSEVEQTIRYLRETGAPPSYIQRRKAELEKEHGRGRCYVR